MDIRSNAKEVEMEEMSSHRRPLIMPVDWSQISRQSKESKESKQPSSEHSCGP